MATPTDADIPLDDIVPGDTGVSILANWTDAQYEDTIHSGNKFVMPIFVTIPHQKTTTMEVAVMAPTQAGDVVDETGTLVTSVTKALFVPTDITFGDLEGKNVLCANPLTDLQRSYTTIFDATSDVETFMQVLYKSRLRYLPKSRE